MMCQFISLRSVLILRAQAVSLKIAPVSEAMKCINQKVRMFGNNACKTVHQLVVASFIAYSFS